MPQLHTYLHWGVNRYAENTSKVLAHLVFILKRFKEKMVDESRSNLFANPDSS